MSREMKDSGVEWIGEIPKDWEIKPLKHILKERKEKNDPIITKDILSLTNDRGVIPYDEKGNQGNKSKNDLTGYKIAYPNDIVLNSMNVVIGSVGKSKYFGCVSPVYYMLYPINKNFDIDYYNFIFQTKVFQNNLKGYGNGILEIRMRISMEKLNTVCLPVPSIKLQREIVNFLNEKVGEIDRLIDNAKKSIEEYKEYKQSIITEAVTKGLDPNLEMKDSGIEWIGEIPKDWNISNIGRMCFVTKLAGFEYTKDMVNNISYNGEVPIVRAQNIKMGRFIDNINEYISTDLSKELDRSALNKKCLIMTFIGAGIGEVAIFNKKSRYHLAPNVAKIVINNNMNKFILEEFLLYFIMSFSGQEEINKIKKSTAQPSLSMETIRSIKIIVTKTLKEQKDIVSYLDSKCAEIDSLISKKEKLISELEKYKKSLIYEYVTGKKEVL